MKGSVFRRCSCRDGDGKLLHGRCPDLSKPGHGTGWWFRYDAPRGGGGKRRQPIVGPFRTKKEAEGELSTVLAALGAGSPAADRSITVGAWLETWLAGKIDLRPSSARAAREAITLYWSPALGHLRLVDLRAHHIAAVIGEMRAGGTAPGDAPTELGRRLAAARTRPARPLSAARTVRVFAVLHTALGAAVPSVIAASPAAGVRLPRVTRVRPLAWVPAREQAWRSALAEREAAAEAAKGGPLASRERQRLWELATLRPSPVMVWLPAHAGAFLDAIAGERLYALFTTAVYCGLRRGELLGLTWAETDLDQGVIYVRETGAGLDPKSDAGFRPVALPSPALAPLKAWHRRQAAERLEWGPDWTGSGLVFTREDGTPLPDDWPSERFATLAFRCGLPPVRFHDLRHGTASQYKAAKLDSKVISDVLGHQQTSFTDSTYVLLFPEVAAAAAEAAAAVVPRAADQSP